MQQRLRCRAYAFTFIELVLVLLLIGVLAGIVIPQINNQVFEAGFYADVRRLEKALQFAHASAIFDSAVYKMSLDIESRMYALWCRNAGSDETFERVAGKAGQEQKLARNVTFGRESEKELFFYPDGSSSGGTIVICAREREARISLKQGWGKVVVSYTQ